MQERGIKRKQSEIADRSLPAIKIKDPYPEYPRPTPEECLAVRDELLNFHGFPQQFVKYQRNQTPAKPEAFDGENSGEEKESVLDGLVSTILSQNTTDANSTKAFASLKSLYPTWQNVSGSLILFFQLNYCFFLCKLSVIRSIYKSCVFSCFNENYIYLVSSRGRWFFQ